MLKYIALALPTIPVPFKLKILRCTLKQSTNIIREEFQQECQSKKIRTEDVSFATFSSIVTRQPQTFHLLHLRVLHLQPFLSSLVTFSSYPKPSSPLHNNASTPPPKFSKSKHDNSQSSLTAIARQFSSPAESTGFKLIHVSIRYRLPLQQLRSNLSRLHINTRRILDIHYSDRNLVSFLIHIGYETELRSQLKKFNITVRNDFDPLDPSTIRDPTFVSEPIDCKVQRACKAFLHRICVALRRFRTPIYNAVANFFVQFGLIDLDKLALYDLAPTYKYRTGYIFDHV
ncbi:hypothetical protein G6F37_006935 [Rhizopus arrhizus]|nr:hypothetical protein G6F38_008485 [Rhizopus arrhizus]KAG1157183.1 hypothetical protein G6F37_006935 [Rhizopus arrhizus]